MRALSRSICRAPQTSPGSCFVLGGAELARLLPPVPDTQLSLPRKWASIVDHKFINPQQPLLAYDKVRHVGGSGRRLSWQKVAMPRKMRHKLVTLDLDPLPAVVDPEAAIASRRASPSRPFRDQSHRPLSASGRAMSLPRSGALPTSCAGASIITAMRQRQWSAAGLPAGL